MSHFVNVFQARARTIKVTKTSKISTEHRIINYAANCSQLRNIRKTDKNPHQQATVHTWELLKYESAYNCTQ